MGVAWDPKGEGYECHACEDETRALRYCTKGFRRPDQWEEVAREMGEPEVEEDRCPVLRVPWWASAVVRDVPIYRTGGTALFREPEWWFDLVSYASLLCHGEEAKMAERVRKRAETGG